VCSWALAGGQSHANIEDSGLVTAGISAAWRFERKV
jgi:hypothetical protein